MLTQRTFSFPFSLLLFLLLPLGPLTGQGLIDGFFSPRGELAVTGGYTFSTFDEFYVGDQRVGPVPAHESIDQSIFNIYAKYGLTDNVTLIANAPYVRNQGNGVADPINGQTRITGFQDIGLAVKYRPFRSTFAGGYLDGIAALGVNIPTGYEPNGILSLGSGTLATDFKVGTHLQLNSGLFAGVIGGYSLRGEADNNLEVGDGSDFDVPDALNAVLKVGYGSSKFYVASWIEVQQSLDGVDIMGEGFFGNFPETEVNYTRVGVDAFLPLDDQFGISAGYGTLIDGRNVGDASYFTGGLTLKF